MGIHCLDVAVRIILNEFRKSWLDGLPYVLDRVIELRRGCGSIDANISTPVTKESSSSEILDRNRAAKDARSGSYSSTSGRDEVATETKRS
jgi:hypothetical protein